MVTSQFSKELVEEVGRAPSASEKRRAEEDIRRISAERYLEYV